MNICTYMYQTRDRDCDSAERRTRTWRNRAPLHLHQRRLQVILETKPLYYTFFFCIYLCIYICRYVKTNDSPERENKKQRLRPS